MPVYLSQEWCDEVLRLAADLPERPGATATMQYHITDAPEGDVDYFERRVDGRLIEVARGVDPDADVEITVGYATSIKVRKGEMAPQVAVAQGLSKISGNMGKMLSLTPTMTTQEHRTHTESVIAMSEW